MTLSENFPFLSLIVVNISLNDLSFTLTVALSIGLDLKSVTVPDMVIISCAFKFRPVTMINSSRNIDFLFILFGFCLVYCICEKDVYNFFKRYKKEFPENAENLFRKGKKKPRKCW